MVLGDRRKRTVWAAAHPYPSSQSQVFSPPAIAAGTTYVFFHVALAIIPYSPTLRQNVFSRKIKEKETALLNSLSSLNHIKTHI